MKQWKKTRKNPRKTGGSIYTPFPNISYMVGIFNSIFGDNWVLTGSVAVEIYAYTFGIHYALHSDDIDVLYVAPDFNRSSFFGFHRVQSAPERSMKYIGPKNISFDLSIVPRVRYIELNGIRLLDPRDLLDDYKTYVGNAGRKWKESANYTKIGVLQSVLSKINLSYSRTLSIPSKRITRKNISLIRSQNRRPPLLLLNSDSNTEMENI